MPDVVDLMDKAFAKIQRDGKKIMDDTFMFSHGPATITVVPTRIWLQV